MYKFDVNCQYPSVPLKFKQVILIIFSPTATTPKESIKDKMNNLMKLPKEDNPFANFLSLEEYVKFVNNLHVSLIALKQQSK